MALTGTVHPHRRGFGFVDLDEPLDDPLDGPHGGGDGPITSLFVPPPALQDLLDGDVVACEAIEEDRGRRSAGSLVLLRRRRHLLVGLLFDKGGRLVLRPDPSLANRDWSIPEGLLPAGAKAGQACVLTVGEASLDGSLRRCGQLVAGPVAASSWRHLRMLAAVRHLGSVDRDDAARAAAADDALVADLGDEPPTGAAATPGTATPGDDPPGDQPTGDDPAAAHRADRRAQPCCTIDGPTTRDLDDAVWAERTGDGVRVEVHIADAASAVPAGSPLDRRARTRATTTYLAVGAWPMLPRHVSEGQLSLRPGRDRRALTVGFTVDGGGDVVDVTVEASTIRSAARLTYAQVEGWLTGETAADAGEGHEVTGEADVPDAVREVVSAAHEAAERIGAARLARGGGTGSMFGEAEARPGVDGERIVLQRVVPTPVASRLIERLMVAANEAVAGWLLDRGAPALYRVQPAPDPERLGHLVALLGSVGLAVDVEAVADPAAAEALVDAAADAGLERSVVAGLVASGMQRAGYEVDPSGGHFGLASSAYVHFTSPIRRCADLLVHRSVHAQLAGDPTAGPTADELAVEAPWLDARAGAATRAERFELRLLWADVLGRTIAAGRPYTTTALVGGVRRGGLRVRVDRFDLVGSVPASVLAPGNEAAYQVAPDELSASVGEVTWRLGDRLRVAISEVDRATGDLTFAPA